MGIVTILLFFVLAAIAFSRKIDAVWEFAATLRPLPPSYVQALEKHNSFYQKLPPESKKRFLRKLQQFIRTKEFVPRGIAFVTDEMRALIGSSAVQLTFGLPNVTLRHFERILIYPDEYYSTINKQYHKGEVNPRHKAIVVSWKYFVQGYADDSDGINLGLHEMAHALKLENMIRNGEHNFFSRTEYNKWLSMAEVEMAKIRRGEKSPFRQYAGVNEDEFFATGMELYFEQPHELNHYNPELYKTLSNLLRQDTIRLEG